MAKYSVFTEFSTNNSGLNELEEELLSLNEVEQGNSKSRISINKKERTSNSISVGYDGNTAQFREELDKAIQNLPRTNRPIYLISHS